MSSTGKRKFNSNYCFHALDLYFNEIRHQTYFTSLREIRVYVDISSITWSSSAARKHMSDGHRVIMWVNCHIIHLYGTVNSVVYRFSVWCVSQHDRISSFWNLFLITHMHKNVLFRLIPTAECTCVILSKYAKNEMLILSRKSWRYELVEPSLLLPIDTRKFSHDVSVRPHASKSVQILVRGGKFSVKEGKGDPDMYLTLV